MNDKPSKDQSKKEKKQPEKEKNEPFQIGDIVKVTKKKRAVLQIYVDKMEDIEASMDLLNRKYKQAREHLWDVIYQVYPEFLGMGTSLSHPKKGKWEFKITETKESMTKLKAARAKMKEENDRLFKNFTLTSLDNNDADTS